MRKSFKRVGIVVLLACVIALAVPLTGCLGGLSGTYTRANSNNSASFGSEKITSVEFKAFGDAEIKTTGITGQTTYVDSSYSINGSRITLKAEWDWTGKREVTYSFRQSGNSIYLDNAEYRK